MTSPNSSEAARRFSLRHIKPDQLPRTTGEYLADRIAAIMGSWRFIIVQSALLALWIALNIMAWVQHWDPYPFILLNLFLSLVAAIVRLHGGAIRLEDNAPGLRVVIELPLVAAPPQLPAPPRAGQQD